MTGLQMPGPFIGNTQIQPAGIVVTISLRQVTSQILSSPSYRGALCGRTSGFNCSSISAQQAPSCGRPRNLVESGYRRRSHFFETTAVLVKRGNVLGKGVDIAD